MRFIKAIIAVVVMVIVWNSCKDDDPTILPEDLTLNLRWVKAYPAETKEDVITGLNWNLSFLGATLPASYFSDGIKWNNDHLFSLDLSTAGFTSDAQFALKELIAVMKSSAEYSAKGGIDVGRFVVLTINSTNHYYAITGAKPSLNEFREKYSFDEVKAGILNSTVAFGHRILEIGKASTFDKIAFIGIEGEGSIQDNTFTEREFEAMDFMPNGQLRFALYDINGRLKTAATPSLTIAGKPAKCLWCHEINLIHSLQISPEPAVGYYSDEQFNALIDDRINIVNAYRTSLNAGIDFSKTQDHTKMELLYLSFMQPSAERIANEWSQSVDQVKSTLAGLAVTKNDEFPFLGDELYTRKDVEEFTPYSVIEVPDEPRNKSVYEPDLIHP